ncbi:DUF3891 family protein [Marivirga sp. S37H4]|uniref:DUF3891 family protein n=1 Tax=Marivirga aurantiaca TaxID=2802615 RepID=A0A935C6Z0_9BACT|nr:DUF3891 family protein [Marivirga aurantiaca]MBK6264042.1 DUF3891 family protein [Marivirga aurantiaca]
MIVNHTSSGWLIITQRSHALLSAQICAQWKKDKQPDRWIDTLMATAEHDDANNELEKQDILEENGTPKNYRKNSFDKGYCDKLLNMAMTRGRYITLLISRHIQFLYGDERNAKSYCKGLQKLESSWLKEANCTRDEINKSYKLLEFCDAFSLLICENVIQPEERKIEISNGPDGKPYQVFLRKGEGLIVSPWPFEVENFTVYYETRLLQQLSFKSASVFKKAFHSVPVNMCKMLISKR